MQRSETEWIHANARGWGGGGRGLSKWIQLCTSGPDKLWISNSIFNLSLFDLADCKTHEGSSDGSWSQNGETCIKTHQGICLELENMTTWERWKAPLIFVYIYPCSMLCRESVVFTSIVKHTRQSLGEGYGFNYRVITEQFAGFVPDKVSSIYIECHKINKL